MSYDITEDLKRLGDICYLVGRLGGMAEMQGQKTAWAEAEKVTDYIAELFNAKRNADVMKGGVE